MMIIYLRNAEIAGASALMTLIASFAGWTKCGRICVYEGIVRPFASVSAAAQQEEKDDSSSDMLCNSVRFYFYILSIYLLLS